MELEPGVSPTDTLEGNIGMGLDCRGICRMSVLGFGGLVPLCIVITGVEREGIIFVVCFEVPWGKTVLLVSSASDEVAIRVVVAVSK